MHRFIEAVLNKYMCVCVCTHTIVLQSSHILLTHIILCISDDSQPLL